MTWPITLHTDPAGAPWRRAGLIALGGGVAVIVYWTLFFAGAIESAPPGGLVHEFELAFPVADSLLAVAAITAGVALLRRARCGVFFLVAAGAMSLYLGVLDVSFYSRQGLYLPLSGPGGFELIVNSMCIVGGAAGLRFGWVLWDSPASARVLRVDTRTDAGRKVGQAC